MSQQPISQQQMSQRQMSEQQMSQQQTGDGQRRFRDYFLRPDYDPDRPKPDFKNMNRVQRRRAKVEYDRDGGRFRTWVYAALLVILVGGFALIIAFA